MTITAPVYNMYNVRTLLNQRFCFSLPSIILASITFRKQKFTSTVSKGHVLGLWLVACNPYCLFLFFRVHWLSSQYFFCFFFLISLLLRLSNAQTLKFKTQLTILRFHCCDSLCFSLLWLTAVKNAIISWVSNFRVCVLLKGAVINWLKKQTLNKKQVHDCVWFVIKVTRPNRHFTYIV